MSQRLNIAMLSVHSCPMGRLGTSDTGGMSVYIMELTRELARRGHHIDIFTRAHDPSHETVIDIEANARLVHLPAGDTGIHKLALYPHLADFACQVEQFRKSETGGYDLIFSHYWLSGIAGDILEYWWNKPHMLMYHTVAAAKNAAGFGDEEPDLRVETERNLALKCNRIIAATPGEKQMMLGCWDIPEAKIGVVPCGVNPQRFQIMNKAECRQKLGLAGKHVILYVGRIDPAKGIDRLVEATSLLKDPFLTLVIAGGDDLGKPEMERLKQLVEARAISGQVLFAGLIDQEDLSAYYNAADVTVIPSYYESFGLVALESISCGTPVIMTRVGGAEEVIIDGRNGCLVSRNDPAMLADGIKKVLRNGQLWNQENVRQTAAAYNWSHIAEKMMAEFTVTLREPRLAGVLARPEY